MNFILRQTKVLGIAFLVLLVVGVLLTYAAFTKKFTAYDEVSLETSSIGLQLPMRADIKIRGVIVGEVLDYEATSDGATIELGIYPDDIGMIPANVTGSIVPKTLFGEKYVSLVVPEQPSGTLAAGDTIDRTVVSTEVEAVLNDLQPLLTTVQPEDINMTLTALATALEGRGDQIGESLAILDGYLKRLNPRIPELVEDLRLAGDVSDVYSEILPDVADILDDTVTTTSTLEEREQQIQRLLGDTVSFANVTRDFLDDNEDRIFRFAEVSAVQLRTLSRYSPEFPCLTQGIANVGPDLAEAFRGFKLNIILEVLPRQPRKYGPQDTPVIGEDRGPACLNLPNPPWDQDNPVTRLPDFNDGVEEPTGKGTRRVATGFGETSGWVMGDGRGFAGSPGEMALYRELLAPGLGETPDVVDDLGPLLMAPMARGAKVSVR